LILLKILPEPLTERLGLLIVGYTQVSLAGFASRYQGAFIGGLPPVDGKVSGYTNLGGTAGVIIDSRPMIWDGSFLILDLRSLY